MAKIGINGFGRIGRMCLRICLEKNLEVKHINDPFIDTEYMIYLFKYDSTHGTFTEPIESDCETIIIGERRIKTSREKDPCKLKWSDNDVNFVIEATGIFTTIEKAARHLDAGAKRVIITAPSIDAPMYVYGVNHKCYTAEKGGRVVSATSCTTNCCAPLIKVMNDQFKVDQAMITTIHAITPTQKTLDGPCGKKWRDGRGCLQNIIPTSTGAAKCVTKVIPELRDKITALAFRVPVPNVSVCDITFKLNEEATYEDVKRCMKNASEDEMKHIIAYVEDDCVSSDFNNSPYSCIFDAKAGIPQTNNFMKVVAWYDNEYGYSRRVIDLLNYMYEIEFDNKNDNDSISTVA